MPPPHAPPTRGSWIRYLTEVKLYGNDDPVFPRTRVREDGEGSFVGDGLDPVFWETTQPIRHIVRDAFTAIIP